MDIGGWREPLAGISKQPYFVALLQFLHAELAQHKTIYPPQNQWFRAFELTDFEQTKIIILGQDPYHSARQAEGLSFSVPKGIPIPPSLRNIHKTLQQDIGAQPPNHGSLVAWATQGVLLLNSVLSVAQNRPASHANQGWEIFTDHIISLLSQRKQPLVFMLWGAHAGNKSSLIDADKHLILTAPHPSPLSAWRGFFDCQHFSKANAYLQTHGQSPIDWQL